MGTKQTTKSNNWRSSVVAAVSLAFFGMSVAAFADTYNFYFQKGKKKPVIESTEKSVESDVDANPEVAAEDAEVKSPENSPENSPESSGIRRGSNNQTPIIINNNINGLERSYTPPDSSSYSPEDRPPAKPIGQRIAPEVTVTAVATPVEPSRNHFRFGLSAIRWNERGWNNVNGNNFTDGGGGLLATFGIDFSPAVGINLIGGSIRELRGNGWNDCDDRMRPVFGAELQVTPFRLNMGSWDLIEFGFLAGTSNIVGSPISADSIHVGSRFGVNFGKSFGITTTGRISKGYTMLETGLVARF